jgi:hypothetical protein
LTHRRRHHHQVQKLDFGRKTAAELAADHHHTASKFNRTYKAEVVRALQGHAEIMDVVRAQRTDLHYDAATGDVEPVPPAWKGEAKAAEG